MSTNTGHVMTLANSIIGVSVLAMPFCFKQCGITLAIVMLILSSITSRLACHFLVKSSSMCKRRNFEFLAFYTFGPSGKLLVELGIIGFMMGTCVAFFVVIGDLGPEIISKVFQTKNDATLRSIVLLGLGLCVILPLGLLRNIESLAAVSTVTIGFYFLLIVKIFLESFSHLLAGDWVQKVNFWQPESALQCIPIFAMALSCQTQIFEIYETLPVPSLDKMNSVVRSAVNMCTIVYISVGLLGYIAFCSGNFTGNILLSFEPSFASEMYKLGFVMSIAVSFPLVIFPCRASLYSLIFRRMPVHHELSQTSSYIPDVRFKCLTVAIVGVAMITGLLIPSIELVLGFVGSTIGVAICVIFPALSFIHLTNKETNERVTAKITLFIGLVIMITGSLANFRAATEVRSTEPNYVKFQEMKAFNELKIPKKAFVSTESVPVRADKESPDAKPLNPSESSVNRKKIVENPAGVIRQPEIIEKPIFDQKKEPPFPVPPAIESKQNFKSIPSPPAPAVETKKEWENHNVNEVVVPAKGNKVLVEIKPNEENINKDAIEKEEREMKDNEIEKKKEEDLKQQELLKKLKEHQDEQKKLLREQQKILSDMRNRAMEKSEGGKARKEKQGEEPVESEKKVMEPAVETVKATQEAEKTVESIKKSDEPLQDEAGVKPKMVSVPIPLAKLQSNSQKGNPGSVQSKHEVMGRDILEESRDIKIRDKRDAEEKKTEECPAEENGAGNRTEKVKTITENSENMIKDFQRISLELPVDNGLTVKIGDGRKGGLLMIDTKVAAPKTRDLKSVKANEG